VTEGFGTTSGLLGQKTRNEQKGGNKGSRGEHQNSGNMKRGKEECGKRGLMNTNGAT